MSLKPSRKITVGQAADILGCSRATMRRWSDKGLVKSYRLGPRRDRRFELEQIMSLLTEVKGRDDTKTRRVEV